MLTDKFLMRNFMSVHWRGTAALTFRTKRYSTSYSSHICYGKRFYNDFFLNHNTIAFVHNCLKLLCCVVIKTALDGTKRINYLTVSFQLENVPFNIKSYRLNAVIAIHVHRQQRCFKIRASSTW